MHCTRGKEHCHIAYMRQPTLDLFSGIGGFALALKSLYKTVGYCEIDETCRQVLQNNITQGLLHNAHIHTDVTTLTASEIRTPPVLITAGFPCQDISILHKGLGLKGPRSKLFFQVIRLVKELPSVSYVLLENSAMLRTRGLPKVMKAFDEIGFDLEWITLAAADVGALHVRNRWYGLAIRRGSPAPKMLKLEKYNWSKEPVPRIVSKDIHFLYATKRMRMLGNSVVPQAVAFAYNTLVCMFTGNRPPAFTPFHIELSFCKGKFTRKHWATPVAGSARSVSKQWTKRSGDNLSTQLFHEDSTPKIKASIIDTVAKMQPNPEFWEFLMGYPIGWTRQAVP
jgi:hypothetical protein